MGAERAADDCGGGATGDGPCWWARSSLEMLAYHDTEWGVTLRDERHLFERLSLEGAQAGLSWALVLSKRDGYRRAFAGFDPASVAGYGDAEVQRLLADTAIIRNRAKIEATISNARVIEAMHRSGETLVDLLWSFVEHVTVHNSWRVPEDIPSQTPASKAMSAALRRQGFRFVGPTTCYATMQAAGMVNDHLVSCPRWQQLQAS
jgi:DNA-3-methyladenine glycosylase I